MKKLTALVALAFFCLNVNAQNDSIPSVTPDTTVIIGKRDTIKIGNILIIKNDSGKKSTSVVKDSIPKKYSRLTTNWWIVDLGFNNYSDETNYGNVGSYLVNQPGSPMLNSNDFKLRAGKSINVNIWFFMQKYDLIKTNVSLKYGLGLELNNYRFKSPISFKEDGPIPYSTTNAVTNAPFIFRDSVSFRKNKLAADYITVPLMLSFKTNSGKGKPALSVSFGVSAGYLYSQRNKQVSEARGKQRNRGDYDLEKFKISYIGELGLGPVRFYGSYSPKSMFANEMDFRPYAFGVRFSKF